MLLFVYGSLKKGFSNHHLLEKARFVKTCTTKDKFTMINLGEYPALIEKPSCKIEGELYEIDDLDLKTQKDIDDLEEYPALYDKKIIQLDSDELAFMYYIKDNIINKIVKNFTVMGDGNWKKNQTNENINKEK